MNINLGPGRPNGTGTNRFPIVHPQYNYRHHMAHQHPHHEMLMMQSRSNGVGGVSNSNGSTPSSIAAVPQSPFSSAAVWPYGTGPGANGGASGTSHHHRIAPLHHQQHHPSATTMLLMSTNSNTLNVMNGVVVSGNNRGKPRRGMMRRAVFSDAQRKGLERRFQVQKYISKPDRKRLADKLSLKDSQVIVQTNLL